MRKKTSSRLRVAGSALVGFVVVIAPYLAAHQILTRSDVIGPSGPAWDTLRVFHEPFLGLSLFLGSMAFTLLSRQKPRALFGVVFSVFIAVLTWVIYFWQPVVPTRSPMFYPFVTGSGVSEGASLYVQVLITLFVIMVGSAAALIGSVLGATLASRASKSAPRLESWHVGIAAVAVALLPVVISATVLMWSA